jgi:hypothetical protein
MVTGYSVNNQVLGQAVYVEAVGTELTAVVLQL